MAYQTELNELIHYDELEKRMTNVTDAVYESAKYKHATPVACHKDVISIVLCYTVAVL